MNMTSSIIGLIEDITSSVVYFNVLNLNVVIEGGVAKHRSKVSTTPSDFIPILPYSTIITEFITIS